MTAAFAHPNWIAAGVVLLVLGLLMMRWAARNNVAAQMTDAAKDAALNALRKRGAVDVPDELRAKLSDLQAASGVSGKAKKVAGYALRHAVSQFVGVTGFLLAAAGALAAVLGIFYV